MADQTFVIRRYDPDTRETYDQSFEVDVQPGQTVLDCLNAIKWEQDGTLSFRMSCRHAICGSCAMKVNGSSMLACQTQVSEAAAGGDPVRVGPMGNQPVIKDLVVDTAKFVSQFERAQTWLEPPEGQEPPTKEYRQPVEEFDHWSHASTCIHCGACYSDCTVAAVDENFLGPAALAKAYRFVMDSPRRPPRGAPQVPHRNRRRHLGLHPLLHVRPGLPQGRAPHGRHHGAPHPRHRSRLHQ